MSDEKKLSERVRNCAYIVPDPHPTDTEAGEREVLGLNQVADEIATLEKRLAEADTKIEVLGNDLDNALGMLADWCVAVDENGAGWDYWDTHYKDAMYREGPLRALLDKAIAEARERNK